MNEFTLNAVQNNSKTITLTHKTSGKSVTVVNNESVVKRYSKLGFVA